MAWSRLDPVKSAEYLAVEVDPDMPGDQGMADEVLLHLREGLRQGIYVAIQNHAGRTFIGTPDEAVAFMLEAVDE